MNSTKILLFEYAIYKLIEWRKEVLPEDDIKNFFTRLASLKLIFLLSATKDELTENEDLLDIFDNYCAMQYGPVEIDIYSAIVYKQTSFYDFGNNCLSYKVPIDFRQLSTELQRKVDRRIDILKKLNPNLTLLKASQLVDITHKWSAWRNAMGQAELLNKNSEKMSVESIRNCRPFYG